MAEGDRGDRTEPATPRKREEARKQGNYANSQDLSGSLMLAAGLGALTLCGPALVGGLVALIRFVFQRLPEQINVTDFMTHQLLAAGVPLMLALGGVLGAVLVASLAVHIYQAGWHIYMDQAVPKFERLDPTAGFGKLFSLNSFVSMFFGVFKMAAVSWIAFRLLQSVVQAAPVWWQLPVESLMPLATSYATSLAWSVVLPLVVLGVADYGYRWWKYERDMMMTRQEVQDENKQTEGDPKIKARVRQVQRQRAMRRMMTKVPKATVVITNPTHVAIALQYEPGASGAPVVVAKGEHLIAQRIKEIAAKNGVPIIEEPPLARALLRTVQIGQEIPLEFYRAVAEVLALVYRRRSGLAQAALRAVGSHA